MWFKAVGAWIGLNKTVSLILAGVIAFGVYTGWVYYKGGEGVKLEQATAQIKHDNKKRKSYAKIDRATPFSADKHDAGVYLLQHTRQ